MLGLQPGTPSLSPSSQAMPQTPLVQKATMQVRDLGSHGGFEVSHTCTALQMHFSTTPLPEPMPEGELPKTSAWLGQPKPWQGSLCCDELRCSEKHQPLRWLIFENQALEKQSEGLEITRKCLVPGLCQHRGKKVPFPPKPPRLKKGRSK